MNKQLVRIVVGLSILTIGLLSVVSCVPGDHPNAEAAGAGAISGDARALADAASLARWEGLGQRYSAPATADIGPATSNDTDRWEARGVFFTKMAELQLVRGQTASVARLQAMGKQYGQMASAEAKPNADIARWIAKGDSYSRTTEIQAGLTTDGARWVAKGEGYSSKVGAGASISADAARWIASGERYLSIGE